MALSSREGAELSLCNFTQLWQRAVAEKVNDEERQFITRNTFTADCIIISYEQEFLFLNLKRVIENGTLELRECCAKEIADTFCFITMSVLQINCYLYEESLQRATLSSLMLLARKIMSYEIKRVIENNILRINRKRIISLSELPTASPSQRHLVCKLIVICTTKFSLRYFRFALNSVNSVLKNYHVQSR